MHAHSTAVAKQHPTHLVGILSSPRPKLAVKERTVQIMIRTIHQSGPAQPHCQATPILMLFSHSVQYGRVGVVQSETIPSRFSPGVQWKMLHLVSAALSGSAHLGRKAVDLNQGYAGTGDADI